MDLTVQIFLVVFAAVLFCVATFLFAREKSVSASAAMGFVFLFIVVLSLSKFKHLNGFGFEAETWDQKQVEAAVLVQKLTTLTEASSQQVALMASKLGLLDNGFTNPQLGQLLEQTRQVLAGTDISTNRRDQILEPIVKRIDLNYEFAAWAIVNRAFAQRQVSAQDQLVPAIVAAGTADRAEAEAGKADAEKTAARKAGVASLNKKLDSAVDELNRFHRELSNSGPNNIATVAAILRFISTTSLAKDDELLKQLNEIDDDVRFFDENKSLRREIDWAGMFQ
jgi:hypothetical protein